LGGLSEDILRLAEDVALGHVEHITNARRTADRRPASSCGWSDRGERAGRDTALLRQAGKRASAHPGIGRALAGAAEQLRGNTPG
jgi:hypothetical protein